MGRETGASVEIAAEFGHPAVEVAPDLDAPFVSLAAGVGGGGTLAGDQTLYYAVSPTGGDGREGVLSFLVSARIPPGSASFAVTLNGLRFPLASSGFHVYRGVGPWELRRIASDQPLGESFTDTGYEAQLIAPPDRNYHHANFYWRMERQPEIAATIHSATIVGNGSLQMPEDEYRGMTVRIMRGKGKGQERSVSFNTATTLYLSRSWETEPDSTSTFTVSEAGWRPGASGPASPIQFLAPNRPGTVIQVTGRAANVNNEESPAESAVVTRWVLGGAGGGALDLEPPPTPVFGLALPPGRGGMVEVAGLGFETLENTRTVTAATVALFYWDELAGAPATMLAAAALPQDDFVEITPAGSLAEGTVCQAGPEVWRITEALGGSTYRVERGVHDTEASAHAPGTTVYPLLRKVAIAPFPRDFFGSPASGNWRFPISLADARIVSAEMFVTNTVGASGVGVVNFTQTLDYGLRTLSGGQYTITIDGFLAIQDGAAPDLVVDTPHSVRDIFAVVRETPVGSPVQIRIRQNGVIYCTLEIAPGLTISNSVPGRDLPPLEGGARVSIDIAGVGQSAPGSDLTVVIRL
ncbi:MAG: hypothetical protein IPM24_24725 [Bryobacterales bacterium]|nr:hypothetical protein [Bryobacterales bacterium]